jgi:hypothetical protein
MFGPAALLQCGTNCYLQRAIKELKGEDAACPPVRTSAVNIIEGEKAGKAYLEKVD